MSPDRGGRRWSRRAEVVAGLLSVALIGALGLVISGSAAGQGAAREQDLAEIRRQISRLEERLEGLRAREAGISDEVIRLRVELELQGERLREAGAALALAESAIEEAEVRVADLEEALDVARSALHRRLVGLYRLGRDRYLRLVLAVEPGPDVLEAVRVLRFLVRRDAELVGRYTRTQAELKQERRLLEARREDAASWADQERQRRDHLRGLERRQRALLARVGEERETVAAEAASLLDKERKLSNLIDFLYGRNTFPVEGKPIQEFRGVLDWPVKATVRERFGPRLDPRYQTQVPHNGVDLATEPEAEVTVVFPGKVLFAAPFAGYGQTVVVHHPGRVFTLYAGLESLRVKEQDVLSFGSVVGLATDSLYFEVRVENRPEDPLDWLR